MAGSLGGYLQPQGGGGGGGGSAPATSGGVVSGQAVAEILLDGTFTAGETISGVKAVCFSQSGTLLVARAGISGRMPAVGVTTSNYLSGNVVTAWREGRFFDTPLNFSGWPNRPVFVGWSGDIVASGAPTNSGDILQVVGVTINASGFMVAIGDAFQGTVTKSGDIGSGAVTGRAAAGYFSIASGSIGTNDCGSGFLQSGLIASGQVGHGHYANASVQSGDIASGSVSRFHFAAGTVIDYFNCEASVSGIIAVAWGSGGCFIVPAERQSGLRLPAIGVVAGNFLSGASCPVVRTGQITSASSGLMASGQFGKFLYVGSGGLIINLSGFGAGPSSGAGPNPAIAGGISGALVQRIGVSISGGIDVFVGEPSSGLSSGLLGQF